LITDFEITINFLEYYKFRQ